MNTPPKFLADRLGEIAGRVSVEADRTTIIEATTALRSVAPARQEIMLDPTAMTGPLTKGQRIVAKYEADMIAEPCELAAAIDKALAEAQQSAAMTDEPVAPKKGFAFPEVIIDWQTINAQQFANSRASIIAKLDGFMERKESAKASSNWYSRDEMYVIQQLFKAASADMASRPTATSAEPVAWQWRCCIAGNWGAWLELDQPVERFKSGNWAFNLKNGTAELRPLYATPPSSGNADAVREAFNALSMWCTSARFKIRGRGGFDDQTEREIGIGLVEAEIDRRAAALSSAPVAGPDTVREALKHYMRAAEKAAFTANTATGFPTWLTKKIVACFDGAKREAEIALSSAPVAGVDAIKPNSVSQIGSNVSVEFFMPDNAAATALRMRIAFGIRDQKVSLRVPLPRNDRSSPEAKS